MFSRWQLPVVIPYTNITRTWKWKALVSSVLWVNLWKTHAQKVRQRTAHARSPRRGVALPPPSERRRPTTADWRTGTSPCGHLRSFGGDMPANYGDRPCQGDSAAGAEWCWLAGRVNHVSLAIRRLNATSFNLKHEVIVNIISSVTLQLRLRTSST